MNTTLVYADQFTLTSANSTNLFGAERSFRLSDLYDPDFTSTGHQPYGFDQIKAFYSNFIVKSCDVEVTFSDPSTDGLYVGVMGKSYYDSSTLVGSSISNQIEKQVSWVKALNNTGSQVVRFNHHYDMAALNGLTKTQYLSDTSQFGARVSATPASVGYLSLAVADPASSSGQTVKVTIKMAFNTQFFGRMLEVSPS